MRLCAKIHFFAFAKKVNIKTIFLKFTKTFTFVKIKSTNECVINIPWLERTTKASCCGVLYQTKSTAHTQKNSYEDKIWNTKFTSKLSLWTLKALTIPLARRRHSGLADRKYSPSEDRDKALMAYSCSLANSRFALHSHVCGDNVVSPTTNYSRLISWSLDPLSPWSLAYYRTWHHPIRFGFLIQILPYFKAAMAIKRT